MRPRLDEVMLLLYRAEINCSISCFRDGGWDVKLDDVANGYKSETCVDTLKEAAEWLWGMALKHHPGLPFSARNDNAIRSVRGW